MYLSVSTVTLPHPKKGREILSGQLIDVVIHFMGSLLNGECIFVVIDYFSRLGFSVSTTADNERQFISEEIRHFFKENLSYDTILATNKW